MKLDKKRMTCVRMALAAATQATLHAADQAKKQDECVGVTNELVLALDFFKLWRELLPKEPDKQELVVFRDVQRIMVRIYGEDSEGPFEDLFSTEAK